LNKTRLNRVEPFALPLDTVAPEQAEPAPARSTQAA